MKTDKERLAELERRNLLPHLYLWKFYDWAWKFYCSENKFNFLCAANQISKSSTQIRKAINWATDKSLWKRLWRNPPNQFWYLYPNKPTATTEFYEKWVPEFLPRGTMKDDPVYGWEEEIKNKEIWAIHFKSGVSIYFKTYEQDTQNLQTGSCYAIFLDEECPFEHFNELRSRLIATNGYLHMVFTATLGQDEFRRAMEPSNPTEELFPKALKLQVSMYDCLKYRDGTPSFWTVDRIKEVEASCSTEAEIQKRVYGRFILSSGLKYPSFNRGFNLYPNQIIPREWHVYSGVDIGSGGDKNHPAAIIFIAVRPDFKFGVIFKGWRGDGVITTASDILTKHTELCTFEIPDANGKMHVQQINPVIKSYDWQSKDFFNIATRAGVGFTPADKRRDTGAALLNTLFKLKMLAVMDNDPELSKLVVELSTLKEGTAKSHAKDDLTDATRYAVMPIPWNFEGAAGEIFKDEEKNADTRSEAQREFDERRSGQLSQKEEGTSIEDNLAEWSSYLEV